MNVLVWNCRGLGNPCTETKLVDIVQAKDPSVVFIAETWVGEARLKIVLQRIKFENMVFVPRTSRGGGLVLFWRLSVEVSIEGSGKNFIDAIMLKNVLRKIRCENIFSAPRTNRRGGLVLF